MNNGESLRAFDQIKMQADPRRMGILRLLMAAPATVAMLCGDDEVNCLQPFQGASQAADSRFAVTS